MVTLYKLTDQGGKTQHDTLWGEGVTNTADVELPAVLGTSSVVHAYISKHLALLLNPVHADIANPKLWLAEGEIVVSDGTKVGCRSLTTVKEIELPVWTPEMKVEFAIRCALEVYKEESFVEWASNWLSGKDRSEESAYIVDYNIDYANDPVATYAAKAAKFASNTTYSSVYASYTTDVFAAGVDIAKIAEEVYERNTK
jgi:hypothetical protein